MKTTRPREVRAAMKQKTTQTLFAYWNAVRRERLAPRRFEIEPARIAEILPETFILEKAGAESYRFRLAGTRICEVFGVELRGSDLLDGWAMADHDKLLDVLVSVSERGGVGVLEIEVTSDRGHTALLEIAILPLVHTGQTIDRLLGSIAPTDTPAWLGHEPVVTRRLVSTDVVWPEGKPHDMVERQQNQSPFLPHIRSARIVRSDRRQFRVYDGGRDV